MKRHLFAATLLSALSVPVFAQGLYVFADLERNKMEASVGGGWKLSKTESGYGLGVGYDIDETFAVEVAYRDLADFRVTEAFEDYGTYSSTDITALQASMVANFPLNNEVSLFGRVGLGRIKSKESYYVRNWNEEYRGSVSDSETKALLGVGMRYALSDKWAARLEYSEFADIDEVTLSALSLAIAYKF